MDAYTSLDSVNGKATRKARAWLISRITGSEVTDGEVEDVTHTVVDSKKKESKKNDEDVEVERWQALIKEASTIDDLLFYEPQIPEAIRPDFDKRLTELKSAK
jgi:hypothetical protein